MLSIVIALVDEAVSPLVSLTVNVHCIESLGDTVVGLRMSIELLPNTSPVVRFVHSKSSVRSSPSASEAIPLQVNVVFAKALFGVMPTLETIGIAFSTTTVAVSEALAPYPSAMSTVQVMMSLGDTIVGSS